MRAAPEIQTALGAPGAAAHAPAAISRADAPVLARSVSQKLSNEWLPRAVWTINRTGRPGLVGIALLLGAGLFLFSTHLKIVSEVDSLKDDLAVAEASAVATDVDHVTPVVATTLTLPDRIDMPAILSQLFNEAARDRLVVDTAKYETSVMKTSGVVRHQVVFPVTGAYPQVRAFIDATLAAMPYVALSELALTRKSIAHGDVEAQIRLTVYTRSAP